MLLTDRYAEHRLKLHGALERELHKLLDKELDGFGASIVKGDIKD